LTDWGAHHIDISQWALGVQHTGPVSVVAQGKLPAVVPKKFDWESFLEGRTKLSNAFNTAMTFNIQLKYANGAEVTVCDNYERDENTKFPNGILFEGSEGRLYVNREKLTGKPVEDMNDADRQALDEAVVKLYGGRQPGNHMGNFFECIAKGGTPISDVETHHRTMTSCHLCNIGLMLGRELKWNPDAQRFVDDPKADAFIARAIRPGFKL
jgi:predicted dehydrogenase